MPNFKATVRFLELTADDMLAARKGLEERLQAAGVGRWRVVELAPAQSAARVRAGARWRRERDIIGRLMLVGAALWAIWFFWLLSD